MPDAVIVAAARSPIGCARKGSLIGMRPDDLTAQIVRAALEQVPRARPGKHRLARFGVTVNAISPNAETRMITSIPPERREQVTATIPMGRFADPSEMAAAVAFLASDEAGYITGVVLPVDGGISI